MAAEHPTLVMINGLIIKLTTFLRHPVVKSKSFPFFILKSTPLMRANIFYLLATPLILCQKGW